MDYCEHCGAKLLARWERISPLLIKDLVKLYVCVHKKNSNKVHVSSELELSATEYNNFQKLRFHGLIAHVPNAPGYWLLTKRGGQFLSGQIKIPRSVKIFRNKIQEHSSLLVTLTDVLHDQPFLDMRDDFVYEPEMQTHDKPVTQKVLRYEYIGNTAVPVYG